MNTFHKITSMMIAFLVVIGFTMGVQGNCNQNPCVHVPQEIHHSCDGVQLKYLEASSQETRSFEYKITPSIVHFLSLVEPIRTSSSIASSLSNQKFNKPSIARHISSTVLLS